MTTMAELGPQLCWAIVFLGAPFLGGSESHKLSYFTIAHTIAGQVLALLPIHYLPALELVLSSSSLRR